jgi:hypothetical protein
MKSLDIEVFFFLLSHKKYRPSCYPNLPREVMMFFFIPTVYCFRLYYYFLYRFLVLNSPIFTSMYPIKTLLFFSCNFNIQIIREYFVLIFTRETIFVVLGSTLKI